MPKVDILAFLSMTPNLTRLAAESQLLDGSVTFSQISAKVPLVKDLEITGSLPLAVELDSISLFLLESLTISIVALELKKSTFLQLIRPCFRRIVLQGVILMDDSVVAMCPKGHSLIPSTLPYGLRFRRPAPWSCSDCNSKACQISYHCKECGYDRCENCCIPIEETVPIASSLQHIELQGCYFPILVPLLKGCQGALSVLSVQKQAGRSVSIPGELIEKVTEKLELDDANVDLANCKARALHLTAPRVTSLRISSPCVVQELNLAHPTTVLDAFTEVNFPQLRALEISLQSGALTEIPTGLRTLHLSNGDGLQHDCATLNLEEFHLSGVDSPLARVKALNLPALKFLQMGFPASTEKLLSPTLDSVLAQLPSLYCLSLTHPICNMSALVEQLFLGRLAKLMISGSFWSELVTAERFLMAIKEFSPRERVEWQLFIEIDVPPHRMLSPSQATTITESIRERHPYITIQVTCTSYRD